ncbi:MAG: FemAB family PEP-CTERM system-associated protein [Magnetococcales bacterium]|nr:FemAB family PEP-CTERM system-associated protein [Magnetococcales bacterium]
MSSHALDQTVVRPLGSERQEEAAWDRFVVNCPEATFFHRVGWREVIQRSFGHRGHYLLAERQGEIVGVLPLVRQKSLLFGDALISTPFCVYGGVASREASARQALEQAASALAEEMGVAYLECRNHTTPTPQWLTKDLYYTFSKPISTDPQENLTAIPRKQRAEVRKGIKKGLMTEVDQDVAGVCYDLYAQSVRNLGTPVFSRNYFRLLKEVFGEDCEGVVVRDGGEVVSAVVSFYFRDEVLPYYGGGTPHARRMGGTPFMYWDLMRHASQERGVARFDFGRSKKGSGSFDFKKFYGFEPKPLPYQYHLVKEDGLPNISPDNPKYRLFIQAWKRLPLPVSRWLGPWLAKDLG